MIFDIFNASSMLIREETVQIYRAATDAIEEITVTVTEIQHSTTHVEQIYDPSITLTKGDEILTMPGLTITFD